MAQTALLKHTAPKMRVFPDHPISRVHYPVEQNPFSFLYVDLTHRCNYNCNICYNPVRTLPDLSLDYFDEFCRRLPKKVLFRFVGGEPTLHPKFFDFILTAHKHKHLATFVTNGTKFTDIAFARELKKTKVPVVAALSMDGGSNNDDWYEIIANARCADEKMAALENLNAAGIRRIAISAIIVRGLNEGVIPDLLSLAQKYEYVRYIHYRSVGKVGRFIDTHPYDLHELKELMLRSFTELELTGKVTIDGRRDEPGNKCFGCDGCYQFENDDRIEVGLYDFAGEMMRGCWKRGKLIENDFAVEGFFDNMIEFSSFLDQTYQDYERRIDPGVFKVMEPRA